MAKWTGKSRGSVLGYRIVFGVLRVFGLGSSYFLLRIVTYFYYLLDAKPRNIIIEFYQTHLGYSLSEAKRLCKENFYQVSQSILDKLALQLGQAPEISYTESGQDHLLELGRSGQGGILFSAHLGNWGIAGSLLQDLSLPVNVVMLANEQEGIQQFLDSIGAKPFFTIIPIKEDLSHLVSIYQALKRNELVCINADRFMPGSRTLAIPFLNGIAPFPEGPFALATRMKVNYSFVTTVKTGKFTYHFSATPVRIAEETPESLAKEYVAELEKNVKANPNQWFNYYDFFHAH